MPYLLLFWILISFFTFDFLKGDSKDAPALFTKTSIVSMQSPKKIEVNQDFHLGFEFKPKSGINRFEVILSSEQFAQLHLKENFRFDKNNGCFIQSEFVRNKSLSRTHQKFEFIKSPECRLTNDSILYSSHAPSTAFNYPLMFRFYNQQNSLIEEENFVLKVEPKSDVYLNCQLIRRKEVLLHCSGLDKFGNSTNDNLLVQGSFDHSEQTIEQLISKPSLFKINNPKDFMRFHYHYKGKSYTTNALAPKGFPIFFGDLHTHSSYSDARLPILPKDLFDYAKDVSALDFMAITDHAEAVFGEALTTQQWQQTIQQVKNANKPSEFSAFLGFEWTSTFLTTKSPWGHRTIIYPQYRGLPYRSDLKQYSSPQKLYKATGDVFAYPHHSMISWGSFDYKMGLQQNEKAFEVFSSHGSSEDLHTHITPSVASGSLHKAIQNTQGNFGILAASDTHAGHPGLNNWHNLIHPSMLDGGGLCAVYSQKNTKKSIYQSLMQKRFYGTSGSRILLIPNEFSKPFPLHIYGASHLHHLKIISFDQNGDKSLQTIPLEGLQAVVTKEEVHLTPNHKYYLQIKQKNDELAWIGPFTSQTQAQKK